MHVVKEFASSVLINDFPRGVYRVNQMPVPVVEIDTNVFTEVGEPVFFVQIGGRIISRDFQSRLRKRFIN